MINYDRILQADQILMFNYIQKLKNSYKEQKFDEAQQILLQILCDPDIKHIFPSLIIEAPIIQDVPLTCEELDELNSFLKHGERNPVSIAHLFPTMGAERSDYHHIESVIQNLPKGLQEQIGHGYNTFTKLIQDVTHI